MIVLQSLIGLLVIIGAVLLSVALLCGIIYVLSYIDETLKRYKVYTMCAKFLKNVIKYLLYIFIGTIGALYILYYCYQIGSAIIKEAFYAVKGVKNGLFNRFRKASNCWSVE